MSGSADMPGRRPPAPSCMRPRPRWRWSSWTRPRPPCTRPSFRCFAVLHSCCSHILLRIRNLTFCNTHTQFALANLERSTKYTILQNRSSLHPSAAPISAQPCREARLMLTRRGVPPPTAASAHCCLQPLQPLPPGRPPTLCRSRGRLRHAEAVAASVPLQAQAASAISQDIDRQEGRQVKRNVCIGKRGKSGV